MSQDRFDIPPDDPLFWGTGRGDTPFGIEAEQRRREAEKETEGKPSWIRELQERRRREREKEQR